MMKGLAIFKEQIANFKIINGIPGFSAPLYYHIYITYLQHKFTLFAGFSGEGLYSLFNTTRIIAQKSQ